MKKVVKGLVTLLLLVLCITRTFSTVVVASASHKNDIVIDAQSDETQELAISFIGGFEDGGWDYTSSSSDLYIANVIRYINGLEVRYKENDEILDELKEFYEYYDILNNEELASAAGICHDNDMVAELVTYQNLDGGFGLAKNYGSDIFDTKAAFRALVECSEVDAMINTMYYLVSVQNEDGGFAYQEGLKSNPVLTAEIANIFADAVNHVPETGIMFEHNLQGMSKYLHDNEVEFNILSEENLNQVYQHFYTALFDLKYNKKCDISKYDGIQKEDGSVYADPMATALYLELLVREENEVNFNMGYFDKWR